MALDEIVVTIAGILGIAFVYWFFLMKKERVDKEDHESHH